MKESIYRALIVFVSTDPTHLYSKMLYLQWFSKVSAMPEFKQNILSLLINLRNILLM